MAAPADRSGAKTPEACLIAIAPALAPALRLIVAISVAETLRSAVTTTRPAAASTYQATPSTPERSTAVLAAASSRASKCSEDAASAAGRVNAEAKTTLRVAASSPTVLATRLRADEGSFLIVPLWA